MIVDLRRHKNVAPLMIVKDVKTILDPGRVESLLHQLCLHLLESPCHLQSILIERKVQIIKKKRKSNVILRVSCTVRYAISYLCPDEAGPGVRGEVAQDVLIHLRSIEIRPFFHSDGRHPDPPLVPCVATQK